jgi:hypothetical protein
MAKENQGNWRQTEKIDADWVNLVRGLQQLRPAGSNFPICPRFLASRYSYRSATIGSTRAALLAGIQHASTPVASNNKTVLAKVAGS